MNDANQRAPLFDKRDRDRPFPMASHKAAGAVDRVDDKHNILRETRRCVLGFLGKPACFRHQRLKTLP